MMGIDLSEFGKGRALNIERFRELLGEAESLPVTITGVEVRQFKDDKEVVLLLDQIDECLALNAGRRASMIVLAGRDTDKWIGLELELYLGQTSFNKRKVETIAIRAANGSVPF